MSPLRVAPAVAVTNLKQRPRPEGIVSAWRPIGQREGGPVPGLPAEIARTLNEIAELLVSEESLRDNLRRVSDLARHTVPGCDAAGITLIVEGKPTTEVATDRVVFEVDLVQYDTDEDPHLLAMSRRDAVRIDFVPNNERFVHFAEGAGDKGVLSTLSLPIQLRAEALGALNLCSRSAHGFDQTSQTIGHVLAAQAAIAIAASELYGTTERLVADLQQEADAQDEVALARGMMRVRQECSAEQAEALLRHAALANAETVVEVARHVRDEARRDLTE